MIGNGLTLDLVRHGDASLLSEWHPSRPLAWDVRVHDGREVRSCLPRFFAEVDAVREGDCGMDDFAVIDAGVELAQQSAAGADLSSEVGFRARIDAGLLETEALHFLALAYSALDAELRGRCALDGWLWLDYVEHLGEDLVAVISFNYDMLIERALDQAGATYFHCGLEPPTGLPLGKPHGSIDYRMRPDTIHIEGELGYPIDTAALLNDVPMQRLEPADLAKPRLSVEAVPPLRASQIRHFQWVRSIFDGFAHQGPKIERCVFAGLSCSRVDRPELCDLLKALGPDVELVVANPDPEPVLVLERLAGRPVSRWANGPDLM